MIWQTAKLHVGDKVIPNGRAPKWLMADIRRSDRCRTVVSAMYDPTRQARFYILGHKAGHPHDIGGYGFRSYQLTLYRPGPLGRPRLRRTYRPTATPSPGVAAGHRPGMIVAPLPM